MTADPWDNPVPRPVTRPPDPVLGWAYLRCVGRRAEGGFERYFAGAGPLHGWVERDRLLEVSAGRWWLQVEPAPQLRDPYLDEVDEEADAEDLRRGMRHHVRYVGPVRIALHRLPDNRRAVVDRYGRASLAVMPRPQLARRARAFLRDAAQRRYSRAGA